MKIRFGYVAIALGLDEKLTSSSTVTFSNYRKIHNDEERLNKLKKVTLSNLEALKKILEYNIEKNIHFYTIHTIFYKNIYMCQFMFNFMVLYYIEKKMI